MFTTDNPIITKAAKILMPNALSGIKPAINVTHAMASDTLEPDTETKNELQPFKKATLSPYASRR